MCSVRSSLTCKGTSIRCEMSYVVCNEGTSSKKASSSILDQLKVFKGRPDLYDHKGHYSKNMYDSRMFKTRLTKH